MAKFLSVPSRTRSASAPRKLASKQFNFPAAEFCGRVCRKAYLSEHYHRVNPSRAKSGFLHPAFRREWFRARVLPPLMSTPKSVLELAKKTSAKMIDIKFVDTFGTWQHFSCPIRELNEEIFSEGLGFDGSSIRGWKSIEASDML